MIPAQHRTPGPGVEVLQGKEWPMNFINIIQKSLSSRSSTSNELDMEGVAFLVDKVAEELTKVK